jgi:hypothetical protein
MTQCPTFIRGRALRVTKLNGCGTPVPGSKSQVVSKGFISVGLTANTEEGEEIRVTNANGDLCISDTPAPKFTGYELEINLCGVDPDMIALFTGNQIVYNEETVPEAVGFRINSGVNLDDSGFALELWTGVAGDSCAGGEQTYGYMLIPFVKGGVLGDFTVENGAVNFVITGAQSKDGSAWGVGPYDVVLDGADVPSPLATAIDDEDHLHVQVTSVAPPTAACGASPLGTEATGATEVEGGEATLTPANSYPPADLADAATGFTASPGTAWDPGSYVTLEDGSHAYWGGAAWIAGEAP